MKQKEAGEKDRVRVRQEKRRGGGADDDKMYGK